MSNSSRIRTAASALLRQVSLDRVLMAAVSAGCAAVIVDADQQGRLPLRGQLPATGFDPANKEFTMSQSRQSERDGYLVVDNFLSPLQVRRACGAIQVLDEENKFLGSPIEREHYQQDNYERTKDRVLQFRETEGDLAAVRQQIAGFARSVVDSDFGGFRFDGQDDRYEPQQLQVQAQTQVSICGGQGIEPTHNFHSAHLDNAGADRFWELGLLGWLRSHHLRRRYLTCIVYLNENWQDGDGGCLRVYARGDDLRTINTDEYVDIAPLAGRMIVFSSLSQFHQVLPTQAQRYACAVWLTLKE